MYDDDLDFYDRKLRNHVAEEQPIYNQEVFEILKERYANDETLTLYRGINFRTEEDYLNFMNSIEENNGYRSRKADSFSPDKNTVESFAMTQPTYFLNEDLMIAEDIKTKNKERLSGYCGVIVEIQAKTGSVVDISKSDLGIEHESITEPFSIHPCKIHLVESYKMMVEHEKFSINDYVLNEFDKNFKDEFFQYILHHHKDEFNEKSKNYLFTTLKNKNVHEKIKNTEERVAYQSDNLVIIKTEEYINNYKRKRDSSFKKKDSVEIEERHIPIFNHEIFDQAHKGYFLESNLDELSQLADNILLEFTEFYSNNPQAKWHHQQSLVKGVSPFCSEEVIENYQRRALAHKAKEYEELGEEGMSINQLSGEDFNNAINEHKDKLVKFLENLTSEIPEKSKNKNNFKP